jgi:hypothetical protein
MSTTIDKPRDLAIQNAHLQDRIDRLRGENERLRSENRELRAALDAHVARARSTTLFGPLELSAGTCVGPRRRHD